MLTMYDAAYRTPGTASEQTDTIARREAAFRPLRASKIAEVSSDALVLRELVSDATHKRCRLLVRIGHDDDEAPPAVAADVRQQRRKDGRLAVAAR